MYLAIIAFKIGSADIARWSFKEWCENLAYSMKEPHWWDLFWSILWGVWLRRTAWIFEQKRVQVQEVIDNATWYSMELNEANASNSIEGPGGGSGGKTWRRPPDGLCKINTDAVVFVEGIVGFGGIMRDVQGAVLVACCGKMEGQFEVDGGRFSD